MRRDTSQARVAWNAEVSEAAFAEFTQRFPMQGAVTATMSAALRIFCTALEAHPEWRQPIHDAIANDLYFKQPAGRRRKLNISIPTELYSRFNELLPEYGATSWFVRRMLAAMTVERQTMQEQIEADVERMLLSAREAAHIVAS